MPTYEYACKSCGHEFEREQRITDKPVRKCPGCGAMQAKRLISLTSFVLKGDGWYNDLYASSGGKKNEETEKTDGSSADSGDKADKKKKDGKPEKTAAKESKGSSSKKGKKKGSKTKAA
jgi:putative FmdB family regulatory protein